MWEWVCFDEQWWRRRRWRHSGQGRGSWRVESPNTEKERERKSVALHFGTFLAHRASLFVRFHFHLFCVSPQFLPPLWSACNATSLSVYLFTTDCYWLVECVCVCVCVVPVSCHCILNTLSFVLWIFNLYRAQRWRLSRCTASRLHTALFHSFWFWFGLCCCCCHFASSEWASAFSASSFPLHTVTSIKYQLSLPHWQLAFSFSILALFSLKVAVIT